MQWLVGLECGEVRKADLEVGEETHLQRRKTAVGAKLVLRVMCDAANERQI